MMPKPSGFEFKGLGFKGLAYIQKLLACKLEPGGAKSTDQDAVSRYGSASGTQCLIAHDEGTRGIHIYK